MGPLALGVTEGDGSVGIATKWAGAGVRVSRCWRMEDISVGVGLRWRPVSRVGVVVGVTEFGVICPTDQGATWSMDRLATTAATNSNTISASSNVNRPGLRKNELTCSSLEKSLVLSSIAEESPCPASQRRMP